MATDASGKAALLLGGAAVLLVCVTGLVLAWPRLEAWTSHLYWSLVPPSWPHPKPPAGPASQPPAPTPGLSPDAPDDMHANLCPDGSGYCASDDFPEVEKVDEPEECQMPEDAVEVNRKSQQRWASIPLLGGLFQGLAQLHGYQTPMEKAQQASAAASRQLQEASEQWENAYAKFYKEMAKDVYAVTTAVLGKDGTSGGLVQTEAEFVAVPLVQMAYLLVAPTLGLLACSVALVWAV